MRRRKVPTTQRIYQVQQALLAGATVEQLHEATKIDPWFLDQLVLLNEVRAWFTLSVTTWTRRP